MNNFRLLSTKVLSQQQRNRLLQTGVHYSERNFITTSPLSFTANVHSQSLIFTSQNAVKAVFNQLNFKDKKCYCVGEKQKHFWKKMGKK